MLDTMNSPRQATPPEPETSGLGILTVVFVVIGFMLGGLAHLLLQANWLAGIQASLAGTDPKAFWYLSRATAFVGFGLLWLSMALGLSITNRLARLWPGGPAAADLHEYTGLLGLAFGCMHGLLLTGDNYTNFTLAQVLLPFTSTQYRPVWVGIGQFGLYISLVVALSFYVRRFIGYRVWRLLHYLSFASYVMVLIHGFFSGTDSAALWVRGLYLGSVVSLVGLTIYRIVVARRAPARGSSRAAVPSPMGSLPPSGA
jgi:predicted ferric reductase